MARVGPQRHRKQTNKQTTQFNVVYPDCPVYLSTISNPLELDSGACVMLTVKNASKRFENRSSLNIVRLNYGGPG
jgi:hypothetical protein